MPANVADRLRAFRAHLAILLLHRCSGGVRSSRIAATHLGANGKVAVAEHAPLGGTCVNVGCVPKKLMCYGSHFLHDVQDAQAYGWDVPQAPQLQWTRFIENKNNEILRLNGMYSDLISLGHPVAFKRRGCRLRQQHAVVIKRK